MQAEEAIARSLIIKLTYIHTDIKAIHDHLLEGAMLSVAGRLPYAGAVKPLLNFPASTAIEAHEAALLLPLKDDDVTNAVISLARVRDALFDGMKVYSSARTALQGKMGPKNLDEVGATLYDLDTIDRHKVALFELEQMLENLTPMASDYLEMAETALYGAHRLLSKKYSIEFSLNAATTGS